MIRKSGYRFSVTIMLEQKAIDCFYVYMQPALQWINSVTASGTNSDVTSALRPMAMPENTPAIRRGQARGAMAINVPVMVAIRVSAP
jgi:hypothetical protein